MAELSIDEIKSRLQDVKNRADALIRKKDDLIRQSAQNEEQRQQAIRELGELGHPEAADLDLPGLQELAKTLTERLTQGVQALEEATTEAEKLLGVAKSTEPLDL